MEYLIGVGAGASILALLLLAQQSVRLGRIEGRLARLLQHQGLDPFAAPALSERARQLAADPARKIEAIKVVREETGAGLAEAKAAVEAHSRSTQG